MRVGTQLTSSSTTGDSSAPTTISGAVPDEALAKVADLLANALGNGRM